MSARKIKVAFCHIYLSPYRIGFFEKLSKSSLLDVDFFIGALKPEKVPWGIGLERIIGKIRFKCRILFSLKFKGNFPIFNVSLPFRLIKGKYHVFLSGALEFPGTYIAFICSRALRKPFILWFGETYDRYIRLIKSSFMHKLFRLYIFKPIIKWILKSSDAFIVYGFEQKKHLIYLGAPVNRIHIALNAHDVSFITDVNTNRFSFLQEKYKMFLESKYNYSKKYILYTGSITSSKRLDTLLYAFKLLSKERNDVDLLIVGSGPYKSELVRIAERLNATNVHFLDAVMREELVFFYNLCDLFVLPGPGGVTLVEAMYAGKPVIASYECDNALLLIKNNVNGYIVSPGDIRELYLAIKNILLKDRKTLEKMGRCSRKIVEQTCSIDSMARVFENVIVGIVKKRFNYGA
jgi:glycosyltransferase involved in cell wall biosynthesis